GFADSTATGYDLAPEAIIFTGGSWRDALNLFGGLTFDGDNTAEKLLEATPFLIIPSGGLTNKHNDSIFKLLLEQYVRLGGTIIVFSQQYGRYIDEVVPVPHGEILKSYGWREDQSCEKNSVYSPHVLPQISSANTGLIDIGIDGYFEAVPSTATTILRRRTNNKPALVSYPYGQNSGSVILFSAFSDYASGKSMLSTAERKVVRDLLTYARNCTLPIPMFNLTNSPTPSIELNLHLENDSHTPASKVKLTVYSPDRKIILHETEQTVSIAPFSSGTTALSFTLPEELTEQDGITGICHTDYELYGTDNNEEIPIRLSSESNTGRFALYRTPEPYASTKDLDAWIVSDKELFGQLEDCRFTVYLKNNTQENITLDCYYDWNHQGNFPIGTITVPANSEIQHPINSKIHGYGSRGIQTFWFNYKKSGEDNYKRVRKGVTRAAPVTKSSISFNDGYSFKVGTPFSYAFSTKVDNPFSYGNYSLRMMLRKRGDETSPEWPYFNYENLGGVYENTISLENNTPFVFNGTFTPQEVLTSGRYELKLEVIRPDNVKEIKYKHFYYRKPNVGAYIHLNTQQNRLMANETYTLNVYLTNKSNFPVTNGKCTLLLESDTGARAFSKEITGITLSGKENKEFPESFVFTPPHAGIYTAKIIYEDESGNNKTYSANNRYRTGFLFTPSIGKSQYNLGETIGMTIDVQGIGNFLLTVKNNETGFLQTRTVTLTTTNTQSLEYFEMPYDTYLNRDALRFDFEIENLDTSCGETTGVCRDGTFRFVTLLPIKIEGAGSFGALNPAVNAALDFNVTMKAVSGFTGPVTGELTVKAPGLAFEEIKTVTVTSTGDNLLKYQIPVPEATAPGSHSVEVMFTAFAKTQFLKTYTILIPTAGIALSAPAAELSAGNTFDLEVKNPGGKNGEYQVQCHLTDMRGQKVLEYTETLTVNAGQEEAVNITLPAELQSGNYVLVQKAKETHSGKETTAYSQHHVTGLSASLNSYTLKEKYFDNETVTAKSDIASGSAAITNAHL
ncbi:MAG: hypothetical protein GY757_26050, partial [bacterium]|nr:hypothetical protein [bacterium]